MDVATPQTTLRCNVKVLLAISMLTAHQPEMATIYAHSVCSARALFFWCAWLFLRELRPHASAYGPVLWRSPTPARGVSSFRMRMGHRGVGRGEEPMFFVEFTLHTPIV